MRDNPEGGELDPAPQLENIPWWGKNIFKERQTSVWGSKNILNIINNSENFRGEDKIAAREPLSCGPGWILQKVSASAARRILPDSSGKRSKESCDRGSEVGTVHSERNWEHLVSLYTWTWLLKKKPWISAVVLFFCLCFYQSTVFEKLNLFLIR